MYKKWVKSASASSVHADENDDLVCVKKVMELHKG